MEQKEPARKRVRKQPHSEEVPQDICAISRRENNIMSKGRHCVASTQQLS
ncbi:hypothetical protein RP20_CCG002492 [Aedes albopictus]|nr:hypothetical protein RP20_CCG002492 [Aedes albopictus]